MEPVPQTYVSNQQILDTELNDLCQRAVGARPADTYNQLTTGTPMSDGLSELVWVMGGGSNVVVAGNLAQVDATTDWRDRVLYVMDEPSIGLHPRDHHRLLNIIGELKELKLLEANECKR